MWSLCKAPLTVIQQQQIRSGAGSSHEINQAEYKSEYCGVKGFTSSRSQARLSLFILQLNLIYNQLGWGVGRVMDKVAGLDGIGNEC